MFSANGLSFTKIIIAIGRTDMRRGIDGLSASVRLRYGLDPLDPGTLFLFCGIRKDRIILVKLNSCRRQVFSLTAYTAETNLARQLNSFASIKALCGPETDLCCFTSGSQKEDFNGQKLKMKHAALPERNL